MSKKRMKNSINTNNPFSLIQSMILVYKDDTNLRVGIRGTKFKCFAKNKFEMEKFEVLEPVRKNDKHLEVYKLMSRVSRFLLMCKNPIEVIDLLVDTYNLNREDFSLKITTLPVHRDAIDSRFVYNELVND